VDPAAQGANPDQAGDATEAFVRCDSSQINLSVRDRLSDIQGAEL
jgi:hypothetical protein